MDTGKEFAEIVYPRGAWLGIIWLVAWCIVVLFGLCHGHWHRKQLYELAALVFSACAYACIMFNARIVMSGDSIVLPKTDNRGFPLLFSGGKNHVLLDSVTRIRIFPYEPKEYNDNRLEEEYLGAGGFWLGGKMLIVSKQHEKIILSARFFGEAALNMLMARIQAGNTQVEVIDNRDA